MPGFFSGFRIYFQCGCALKTFPDTARNKVILQLSPKRVKRALLVVKIVRGGCLGLKLYSQLNAEICKWS